MATTAFETRVVDVGRTNGHGFQATTGDWLNFSKFAKPDDIRMPSAGDTVTVYLDKAGFVRRIIPAERVVAQVPTAPARMASSPTPTPAPSTVAPAETSHSVVGGSPAAQIAQDDRGTIITRLAVLNTATAILASGGGAATVDEVLTLAAQLEAWAVRTA